MMVDSEKLTKKCCECHKVFTADNFHKDKAKKLGLASRCKDCAKHAVKVWKDQNRKHANESARLWQRKNADKRKEIAKRYANNLPEGVRAARLREWRNANPEKNRAALAKRRSQKKNSNEHYTDVDVKNRLRWQQYKCACCKTDVSQSYHVDHIIPLAAGGTNDKLNIQILCPSCNLTKNAKDPISFMQSKGYLL